MEMARSSDGSGMDRLVEIGSPLPPSPAPGPARCTDSTQTSPWTSPTEPEPAAVLDLTTPGDPVAQQQAIRHFISHIDAECFISLLQTMDPMPDDSRARAEYRRFYRELREVLEVPLLSLDRPPAGAAVGSVK